MKAIVMTGPGPASEVLKLQDIQEPALTADDEIKVEIAAAGINPIDTKVRSRGLFFDDGYPAVLGCDGAGVVVEVGQGVTAFKPGDRVWYCHGGLGREPGNYAQFNILPAAIARPMPKVDFTTAAAAPLVLITAWEALFDRAHLKSGQTVLIHAGAGGVGHVAIQLAKSAGARVITTVSSQEKGEFVKRLGADEVIFYREEDFVERSLALTDNQGVDVVFDTIGLYQQSFAAIKVYGALVTLLDPGRDINFSEARKRNLSLSFELMLTPMLSDDLPKARAHQGDILDKCRPLMEAGVLSVEVADVLPLAAVARGHETIEAGHSRGKLVIDTQSL